MDHIELRQAFSEGSELEYLFDNQWLPAIITLLQDVSSHTPNITIKLLRQPPGQSGIIHPNANDIKYRLRLKDSN
jgi:hypothetical protein